MTETTTPRTDALLATFPETGDAATPYTCMKLLHHAQALERELAEAKGWYEAHNKAMDERDDARRQRDEARKALSEEPLISGRCSWCNWKNTAVETMEEAQALAREHTRICPSHPLRELEAYAGQLLRAIKEHNESCECACNARKDCAPYVDRGLRCPECPRDWKIDLPARRESEIGTTYKGHAHDCAMLVEGGGTLECTCGKERHAVGKASIGDPVRMAAEKASTAIYHAVMLLGLDGNQAAIAMLTDAKQAVDAALDEPKERHSQGRVFGVDEGKPGGDMTCEVEGTVDGNGVVTITDVRHLPGPELGPEDKLPCRIACDGGPIFHKGVQLKTLLGYLARRVTYNNRESATCNPQEAK